MYKGRNAEHLTLNKGHVFPPSFHQYRFVIYLVRSCPSHNLSLHS